MIICKKNVKYLKIVIKTFLTLNFLYLSAPGPEHKTTAHYMLGVFNLELRKEYISSSHAKHPDLVRAQGQHNTSKSGNVVHNDAESSNGIDL